MKITKAFKRNITDDFICGLSADTHDFDDVDDLFANKNELIAYTKRMLRHWEITIIDATNPIAFCGVIKCYKAFLKNNGGK